MQFKDKPEPRCGAELRVPGGLLRWYHWRSWADMPKERRPRQVAVDVVRYLILAFIPDPKA
jgi:hypothetical protein